MKKIAVIAFLVTGILGVFAAPASAHASHVSHAETCNADGTTTTVVTFDNDFSLAADVSYRWGTETPGTVHLAAKTSTTNPTVSLPAHDTGVLVYHVTWSDNFRQPAEGESTLVTLPLTDCHVATTTTTMESSSTTMTTIVELPTTTSILETVIFPVTTTTRPADVLGTTKTLPRTGGPIAFLVTVGVLAVAFGLTFRYVGRLEKD